MEERKQRKSRKEALTLVGKGLEVPDVSSDIDTVPSKGWRSGRLAGRLFYC